MNYQSWSENDETHPEHNKHSSNFHRAEDRILPFSVYISCCCSFPPAGIPELTKEVGAELQHTGKPILPAKIFS